MPTRERALLSGREGGAVRPRIGLVLDGVEAEYQWGMVGAALAATRDAGAVLFVLAGGLVAPPDEAPNADNALFDLVTPESVDAIVLVSSTMGHALSPQGLAEWSRRFEPLPVASIGIEIPGRPSFLVENESGTHQATVHLARQHGFRRIAFVQGAPGSTEAAARLRGYERALAEVGLEVEPRLIVPGDFTVVGGCAAVAQLLDQERINPGSLDAIVTANDAMAFGVIEELERRRIDVPEQVAVIGFDDVMLARVGPPPLTSVRQPIDRLATAAIRNLVAALRGNPEPGATLATELVVRRSCGCVATMATVATSRDGPRSASEVALLGRRDQISAVLARAARGAMVGAGIGWEPRLLMAVIEDARTGGARLTGAVGDILGRLVRSGTDPGVLDDVLSALRAEVNATLDSGTASRHAEDAFHESRRLLHDQLVRVRMRERAELSFGMQTLAHLARQLRVPRDPATAVTDFMRHTRALGCDAGLVAWLDDDRATAHPILHYDRGGEGTLAAFPAAQLWPTAEPDCRTSGVVVHPIVDGRGLVGHCAFSLGAPDGSLHELLRELVSDRVRRGRSLLSTPPGMAAPSR